MICGITKTPKSPKGDFDGAFYFSMLPFNERIICP